MAGLLVVRRKPLARPSAPVLGDVVDDVPLPPLAIDRPFLGEQQPSLLGGEVDDIADAVRGHVYPIYSVSQLLCETHPHI
jgi:hypothetical protein